MWNLEQIYATNIGSFKNLDYAISPDKATLIFGNNMDNESQRSNGSGKSALIEVIAIGLTGAPLRDVKADEIINDAASEATISLLLHNTYTNEDMSITRKLSRKNPQVIEIAVSNSVREDGEFDWQAVPQSSVAEYNKYILDTLGLTKDDIYANYILCKHKYMSFLSSSDKEKKEIINKFSNGNMVDESIEALQADMAPIQDELRKFENEMAMCEGRLNATNEQIQNAINQSVEKSRNKAQRIEEWEAAIAKLRSEIREQNEAIANTETRLNALIDAENKLCNIESKDSSFTESYKAVVKLFSETDIASEIIRYKDRLSELNEKIIVLNEEIAKREKTLEAAQQGWEKCEKKLQNTKEKCEKKQIALDKSYADLTESIAESEEALKTLELNWKVKREECEAIAQRISELEVMLAGTIKCPKCQHEFLLSGDADVEEIKSEKKALAVHGVKTDKEAASMKRQIQDCTDTIQDERKKRSDIKRLKAELEDEIVDINRELFLLTAKVSSAGNDREVTVLEISRIEAQISNLKKQMFDTAFMDMDIAIHNQEDSISSCERTISSLEGRIASYIESIEDIKKSSENDFIETLKASKETYEKDLESVRIGKEKVEKQLADYKRQEALFIEFKTYLANTKIEALSQITNEFLEAIGSDIRIVFSGYTVLKSGKIRDKISISLTRDGVDCGSFGKFSEGEKARVNLANILAMHKLTNVNCPDGKGLNLLILDEILDATDESGLANIFDSLNSLKITSLVVSHGLVQEGYPHKLIVNKSNGISYIE